MKDPYFFSSVQFSCSYVIGTLQQIALELLDEFPPKNPHTLAFKPKRVKGRIKNVRLGKRVQALKRNLGPHLGLLYTKESDQVTLSVIGGAVDSGFFSRKDLKRVDLTDLIQKEEELNLSEAAREQEFERWISENIKTAYFLFPLIRTALRSYQEDIPYVRDLTSILQRKIQGYSGKEDTFVALKNFRKFINAQKREFDLNIYLIKDSGPLIDYPSSVVFEAGLSSENEQLRRNLIFLDILENFPSNPSITLIKRSIKLLKAVSGFLDETVHQMPFVFPYFRENWNKISNLGARLILRAPSREERLTLDLNSL